MKKLLLVLFLLTSFLFLFACNEEEKEKTKKEIFTELLSEEKFETTLSVGFGDKKEDIYKVRSNGTNYEEIFYDSETVTTSIVYDFENGKLYYESLSGNLIASLENVMLEDVSLNSGNYYIIGEEEEGKLNIEINIIKMFEDMSFPEELLESIEVENVNAKVEFFLDNKFRISFKLDVIEFEMNITIYDEKFEIVSPVLDKVVYLTYEEYLTISTPLNLEFASDENFLQYVTRIFILKNGYFGVGKGEKLDIELSGALYELNGLQITTLDTDDFTIIGTIDTNVTGEYSLWVKLVYENYTYIGQIYVNVYEKATVVENVELEFLKEAKVIFENNGYIYFYCMNYLYKYDPVRDTLLEKIPLRGVFKSQYIDDEYLYFTTMYTNTDNEKKTLIYKINLLDFKVENQYENDVSICSLIVDNRNDFIILTDNAICELDIQTGNTQNIAIDVEAQQLYYDSKSDMIRAIDVEGNQFCNIIAYDGEKQEYINKKAFTTNGESPFIKIEEGLLLTVDTIYSFNEKGYFDELLDVPLDEETLMFRIYTADIAGNNFYQVCDRVIGYGNVNTIVIKHIEFTDNEEKATVYEFEIEDGLNYIFASYIKGNLYLITEDCRMIKVKLN